MIVWRKFANVSKKLKYIVYDGIINISHEQITVQLN